MDDGILKMAGVERAKPPMFKDNCGRALSSHALMYIAKGQGYFEDASTRRVAIKPGSVFYLYPGRWHNFDPDPGTLWTECWILFDGDKAERLFGRIIPNPKDSPVVYQYGHSAALQESYDRIVGAWRSKTPLSSELSLYLLHSILMQVFLKINNVAMEPESGPVADAKSAIRRAVAGGLRFDFKEFAKDAGIGYETLRKEFAKETGLSPLNYLMEERMARAMELLMRPNLTVKEIAESLGFDDPCYFSRLFKRREGVSPESYRKRFLRR